jgi:nucleotide-binding universal stress UspA family protein
VSKILVGVDGTRAGESALQWAMRWSERTGQHVHAVAVVSPIAYGAPSDVGPWFTPGIEDLHAIGSLRLERAINALGRCGRPGIERSVLIGPAAPRLVEAAAAADLLVIGAARRSRWNRLRAASTRDAVLRDAACPVVVVQESRNVTARSGDPLDLVSATR